MTKASTSPRVRRKRAERRERIVEAAFAAIAESGPADFSLNQLARDLDYAPGALYWYFPSKEALVVEVQRVAFTELAEKFREAREAWESRASDSTLSRDARHIYSLLSLAKFYLNLGMTSPEYSRLIAFSLDPRVWLDDESAKVLTPVLASVFAEVSVPFAHALGANILSEGSAIVRAVQYWAALQGVLQVNKLARINPDMFDLNILGMDTARTMLLGWGADAKALSEAVAQLTAK